MWASARCCRPSAGVSWTSLSACRDNRAATLSAIDADGRLLWADHGALPLPRRARTGERSVTAAQGLTMLRHTAEQYDRLGAAEGSQGALPGPAEDALPTAS
jgi:hypothetical protein